MTWDNLARVLSKRDKKYNDELAETALKLYSREALLLLFNCS